MTDADRRIDYVRIDTIVGNPKNPKRHSIDTIRESIDRFSFVTPTVLDERTGMLAEGHGRVEALRQAMDADTERPPGVGIDTDGMWTVPVVRGWASASDTEAEAFLIASNRLGELGGWDDRALADQLAALSDDGNLAGLGFDDVDVRALLATVEVSHQQPEPGHGDARIELPVAPITEPGQVWILGRHRVMCGDCRSEGNVASLIAGAEVNMAFTSPPYADRRPYDPASGFVPIPPEDYVEWFAAVAANVAAHLADDGSWFVNIKPSVDATSSGLDTELYVMDLVLAHVRRWGWHFATEFCWERTGMPKNVTQRFKNQFEPIYQFARGRWKMRPDAVRHLSEAVPVAAGEGVGDTGWSHAQGTPGGALFGSQKTGHGRSVTTGLAYPGNRIPTFSSSHEALGHHAAFPVGLPQWFASAFTDPGDIIFDPFLGSGSVLIAAEHSGRPTRYREPVEPLTDPDALDAARAHGCTCTPQVAGSAVGMCQAGHLHSTLALNHDAACRVVRAQGAVNN